MNKLVQYIRDSKNEVKKVTWPTKKEVKQHTILVIVISLAVAFFLGLADFILTKVIEQII
ncbi:preprotein translocase subunit SecE [Candidatus Falkowbacteria bacterium]|uniref:Protein translocase subunit SecE n=1 Tax=Candidatus Buchananbacteria bacterium CG10_big_fil_rev_8_21_14_0_10_33_19 TaxID=1974525 RepID=A0A2H0W3X9_9BACT|nr:preprotein translocase subunit SecE [Candidatus Falkowbacteria bacterium]PIS06073.1 MAG: preprotein translocase subunit SecE [Candidatus Buchananbacteria bacterium CG10_big_fil_rev_8_21_14_0_10_33_19]